MQSVVREPAVAGTFYPRETEALRAEVDAFVERGAARLGATPGAWPKALIVPHAGYVYSGPVAGTAYATLRPARGHVRRIVLIGPAHRVPLRSLALPEAEVLRTPLGDLLVDERLERLVPWVPHSDVAHAFEHSLEVQLPFVLRVLGPDVTVAPFVVGAATPEEVARVLEALWGGRETVVLVSSDLSHYLPYDRARTVDRDTAERIVAREVEIDGEQACGARAIAGLSLVARRRGLRVRVLDLRTSGDTAGRRDEVVGYGAFAYEEPHADDVHEAAVVEPTGATSRSARLLGIARAAFEQALGVPGVRPEPPSPGEEWLRAPGAAFVTLRRRGDGELHGCIGSLSPHRSLYEDVCDNAVAAALRDPRAPEIGPDDARRLWVEVSVLSPLERVPVRSRDELLAAMAPGEHGWVLAHGGRRGTFLPQVWKSLPDPRRFLHELERKAGLPHGFWSPELEVYRYRVEEHAEPRVS
jgi:AmmeMemoRadiSam system protein B/AmmeMemoRadiSam system protein A